MDHQNYTQINSFSQWISRSVTVKMLTIGFLILVLLIPLALITDLIYERSIRKQEVVNEISQSWSREQVINGPIISIPYETKSSFIDEKGLEHRSIQNHLLQILPESLYISGPIQHQSRKRGIYKVILYECDLNLKGHFKTPEIDLPNLERVLWEEAFITLGVSDMKGIQDEIELSLGNISLQVEPGSRISNTILSGFTADVNFIHNQSNERSLYFNLDLNLRGSKQLQFVPLGKVTNVTLTSSWPDPSFNGEFLPTNHTVTDKGFEANWKVLHLNRNFPQGWSDENPNYTAMMSNSAFGVQLFNSADDYQVITRASKYGLMTITITFLVFFLVEIMGKKRIHPMQYILVGLALVLFYILLVSITEHSRFIVAYLIAAASVILMIFGYSISIFKDLKLSVGLFFILIVAYSFILVTLQLVDYALIIGSIGMTLILAVTMYLTRKIDWFNIGPKEAGDLSSIAKT